MDRSESDGRLVTFIGALYDPKGNVSKISDYDELERVMSQFGLSEWQKDLIFSLDREAIAEAIYWEVAAIDPYGGSGHWKILWPHPHRIIGSVDNHSIPIGSPVALRVNTAGVREINAVFELVSYRNGWSLRADSQKVVKQKTNARAGSLDYQSWDVVFNAVDLPPGQHVRLRLDDGGGQLLYKDPLKLVDPLRTLPRAAPRHRPKSARRK